MVGEDTGGLGRILVFRLNFLLNTQTCLHKYKFVMIEYPGMSFTYRSLQSILESDGNGGTNRVEHMLLYDSTNNRYVLFKSMQILNMTLGPVYFVDLTKSVSSFTLDSTIFGVFMSSPGEAPH